MQSESINGSVEGKLSKENRPNRLLLHSSFNATIDELKTAKIKLPKNPSPLQFDFKNFQFPPSGKLVNVIGDIEAIDLDAKKGEEYALQEHSIAAYDESINKFSSLEGTAFLASHSLVLNGDLDFVPTCFLSFYFYTRSKAITEKSDLIKFALDPELESKKDFIDDKVALLTEHTPSGSLLFIDGPLIGGDAYVRMIGAMHKFLAKDIIPIFFIKNSSSNTVTDSIPELVGRFNSDMHWAYTTLKSGQRTNFFRYVDRANPKKNAKVFCYLKAFDVSPQRIEFHVDTFTKFSEEIPEIMNLIYYFLLVQGDLKNPQIRPIAIAEKYARDTLHLVDINKIAKNSGLIPTMNQERFAW